MEVTGVSEVLVSVRKSTRCQLPEDRHFNTELLRYLAIIFACVLAYAPRVLVVGQQTTLVR